MVSLHKMISVECALYGDKSLQLAEGASFLQMLVIVAKAGFSDWSEASRPKSLSIVSLSEFKIQTLEV